MPSAFGGSTSKSMRQIAPFLNSIGDRAPIRRAASSPMFGSWPTSAMLALRECLAISWMTAAGVPAGASESLELDRRLLGQVFGEDVRRLAGPDSGLVMIRSNATPSAASALASCFKAVMPLPVSGRFESSGYSGPRSAAIPCRIRYSSRVATRQRASRAAGTCRAGRSRDLQRTPPRSPGQLRQDGFGARLHQLEQRRRLFDVAAVQMPALVLEAAGDHFEPAVVRAPARRRHRLHRGDVLLEDLQVVQRAERVLRALERPHERPDGSQPPSATNSSA